jgi:hypothetical protein
MLERHEERRLAWNTDATPVAARVIRIRSPTKIPAAPR